MNQPPRAPSIRAEQYKHALGGRNQVVGVAETDVVLVARCRSDDRQAFNEIVARYQDRIYSYVARMVGGRETAEDLAQETFVRAFAGLRSFQSRATLSTWLYRVATNLCIDHLRRTRRSRQQTVSLDDCLAGGECAQPAALADSRLDPTNVLMREELACRLEEAIGALPDRLRSVFVLREVEGLPYEDVAAVVGCPLGTVKSRLHHARMALRGALRGYVADGGPVE